MYRYKADQELVITVIDDWLRVLSHYSSGDFAWQYDFLKEAIYEAKEAILWGIFREVYATHVDLCFM
jgi:hypothetical protein